MWVNNHWYEESELIAYIKELEQMIAELKARLEELHDKS